MTQACSASGNASSSSPGEDRLPPTTRASGWASLSAAVRTTRLPVGDRDQVPGALLLDVAVGQRTEVGRISASQT